jgi:hypothetical protein
MNYSGGRMSISNKRKKSRLPSQSADNTLHENYIRPMYLIAMFLINHRVISMHYIKNMENCAWKKHKETKKLSKNILVHRRENIDYKSNFKSVVR